VNQFLAEIMTFKSAVIIKNVLIFLLGLSFGVLLIGITVSYAWTKSYVTNYLKNDILLLAHEDEIYLRKPKSIREAIDMWFYYVFYTISNKKSCILYKNESRSRRVFLIVMPAIIFTLILGALFSFSVIYPIESLHP
jgi:hypothetical protein